MSVSLFIKLNRAISLDVLKSASAAALHDLLKLDDCPVIDAEFDQSDRCGSRPGGLLDHLPASDRSFLISEQNYLSVTWHYKKTELCWALVAAVVLALATEEGADIEDNSGFFTIVNVQSPDQFPRGAAPAEVIFRRRVGRRRPILRNG